MKKIIITLYLLVGHAGLVLAGGGGASLDPVDVDITQKSALQRGAKYFVNYCVSCHSAKHMRYNRLGQDADINDALLLENLIFDDSKVGQPMQVAMRPDDSKAWFGSVPPDLSVVARSRGVDWLYAYLRGFYIDNSPTRPFGVNNTVFKDVGMPNVLWELQGWQVLEEDEHGQPHLTLAQPGKLSPEEFDRVVKDLVTYMAYMGEPAKLQRLGLGTTVIFFLIIFTVIAYYLKKEYWKDVH